MDIKLAMGQALRSVGCKAGHAWQLTKNMHRSPDKLPACPLQEHALPHLASIITSPSSHEPSLVEGALDMVTILLKPATTEQAARMHAALSGAVLRLMLHHDDPGILQSCCEYMK